MQDPKQCTGCDDGCITQFDDFFYSFSVRIAPLDSDLRICYFDLTISLALCILCRRRSLLNLCLQQWDLGVNDFLSLLSIRATDVVDVLLLPDLRDVFDSDDSPG